MIPNAELLRILDANANRAREALRVLEDYARFALDDVALTTELKEMRHGLAAALGKLPMEVALRTRDTLHDVGTNIKTPAELMRASTSHVLTANAKRLSESLRSLEECAKVIEPAAAAMLEKLRYRGYAAEQRLTYLTQARDAADRFRAVRLYVLLTDAMCRGGWETTLDAILEAAGEGDASMLCIQLREKDLPDDELLRRAMAVVQKCHAAGVLVIMNDRADVALMAEADGVHLGQTDAPCADVRALMGPQAIIGVSTERLEQAHTAVQAGASYIAVGPMFSTTTKEKSRVAGPAYAAEVIAASIPLPIVAIGGINLSNVSQLVNVGIRTVAVSSAVLCATDPGAAVRGLLAALKPDSD